MDALHLKIQPAANHVSELNGAGGAWFASDTLAFADRFQVRVQPFAANTPRWRGNERRDKTKND